MRSTCNSATHARLMRDVARSVYRRARWLTLRWLRDSDLATHPRRQLRLRRRRPFRRPPVVRRPDRMDDRLLIGPTFRPGAPTGRNLAPTTARIALTLCDVHAAELGATPA